jgi:glycosyltransferase involved in cell wall biosynthesis
MRIAFLTSDSRQVVADYSSLTPGFGTAPEALLQGLAQMPHVEVHVISCAQKPTSSPSKLAENIFFHGLLVPKFGWLRTGYQGCVRAVRKQLREIKPHIVHGQGTERDCAISAVFSGFPNVITIHGNMRLIAALNQAKPFSYQWIAARLEEFTIPKSDGVVCITNHTRSAVVKTARRTWVLPNAVDASFFEIKSEPDVLATILCVATISSHKNQNNLIRALDAVAAHRKFRLVFLGAINAKEPYGTEFIQLLQSRPWCSYEGFADREKLKRYFQRAAMVVLPSLEDNCPMVVLEGMAAGVPVVAAKVGGVPDLIEDNKTGLFCDPLDPASIRDGVLRFLDDSEFAGRMATAAMHVARERFHPISIARQHLEIYKEVIKTRS